MQEFFTKEANSTPQKLPLKLKTGEPTEHYLMLVGVESDVFRIAQSKALREGAIRATAGEYDDKTAKDLDLNLVASLIDSWSFEQDCTQENKVKFLDNAPYVRDAVNSFSAEQDNFLKK